VTDRLAARDVPGRFCDVRTLTEELAAPLSPEDQTVQSMPDTSPTKWHRAHTTWFFEEFLLGPHLRGYEPFHRGFRYLFNSYYEVVGPRHPRPKRGVVTRPGAEEVAAYRRWVDAAVLDLVSSTDDPGVLDVAEIGLHHEQQHQELLLMDIKHVLAQNVLDPAYTSSDPVPGSAPELGWIEHPGGAVDIGHDGDGFAFDNESPLHRVLLEPFSLATRAATNAEWLAFMDDGGYQRPELWLSDGWAAVQAECWEAPLYWRREGPDWSVFSLRGRDEVPPDEPVCHVSYYEADAYARWSEARLPTEAEWEAVAADTFLEEGRCLDPDVLHPRAAAEGRGPSQLFGDVWEWTASPYVAYPGFRPASGAVGEYNGKFMVNQHVLRGGACVTPRGHIRTTYRNFFPPGARWVFAGVRLARGLRG
jgi:ergothioneine biosynthesis protein EgtB